MPTSHVDLIPTLMGLAGIDLERATAGVMRDHTRRARCRAATSADSSPAAALPTRSASPIYFMTEDQISQGLTQANVLTGEPFESLRPPSCIESVVATLPTGEGGAPELWKLNHYYERLDEWNAEHGVAPPEGAAPAAEPAWELHNLTVDPEERHNRAGDGGDALRDMRAILDTEREAKRLVSTNSNLTRRMTLRLSYGPVRISSSGAVVEIEPAGHGREPRRDPSQAGHAEDQARDAAHPFVHHGVEDEARRHRPADQEHPAQGGDGDAGAPGDRLGASQSARQVELHEPLEHAEHDADHHGAGQQRCGVTSRPG